MATLPTPLHRLAVIKTRGQQVVEQRLGEPLEMALRRRYVTEGRTQEDIATEWGLDRATVSRWLRDFGITRLDRA